MCDRRFTSFILRTAACALPALLLLTWVPFAAAQKDSAAGFPSKAIRLVVPFLPGDAPDIVARVVGTKMAESWGAPIVLDNKPGATGNIGMNLVAKSAPDGYTLGVLIISHSVNSAVLGSKMPYSILRDLSPIAQLVSIAYVLSVNPKLPVKSVADLVAYARANPGAVRYGSSGTGGVIHLAGELLALLTKVEMTHVPYKGNSQAMTDIVGGHIEWMVSSVLLAKAFSARGQVRPLAVTSLKRLPSVPDLPTMEEAGIPGYEVEGWYGIAGPAGIPRDIIDKLNREMVAAVRVPATRDRLDAIGVLPVSGTPAQFGALLKSEDEKWRRVVNAAGLARE